MVLKRTNNPQAMSPAEQGPNSPLWLGTIFDQFVSGDARAHHSPSHDHARVAVGTTLDEHLARDNLFKRQGGQFSPGADISAAKRRRSA
jgi:hypothetical protein